MSKTKDWATSKVEQELDSIKDKLVNNMLTLDDAASQIENIDTK